MSVDRNWMYKRFLSDGSLNPDFLNGLESFIQFASSQLDFVDGANIKCPCKKCDNVPYLNPWEVRTHIGRNGFVKDYYIWKYQGEKITSNDQKDGPKENRYIDMIFDPEDAYSSIGPSQAPSQMDTEVLSQQVDQLVDERVAERVAVFEKEHQRNKERITDLESKIREMREEHRRMMEMFKRGGGHGSS